MTLVRFAALLFILLGAVRAQVGQDWSHYVRIAGHSLRLDNVDQIIRSATKLMIPSPTQEIQKWRSSNRAM